MFNSRLRIKKFGFLKRLVTNNISVLQTCVVFEKRYCKGCQFSVLQTNVMYNK